MHSRRLLPTKRNLSFYSMEVYGFIISVPVLFTCMLLKKLFPFLFSPSSKSKANNLFGLLEESYTCIEAKYLCGGGRKLFQGACLSKAFEAQWLVESLACCESLFTVVANI